MFDGHHVVGPRERLGRGFTRRPLSPDRREKILEPRRRDHPQHDQVVLRRIIDDLVDHVVAEETGRSRHQIVGDPVGHQTAGAPKTYLKLDLAVVGMGTHAPAGRYGLISHRKHVEAGRLPADVKGAVALDERVGPARLIDVADAAVAGLERRLPTVPDVLDAASLDELDRFDWLRHRWVEHRLSDRKPAVGLAAGIAPDGALLLRPRGEALRRVVAGSIEVGGS